MLILLELLKLANHLYHLAILSHPLPSALLPTLAMEMVCCSITSWMDVRSASIILSNSSMQHTPWSANTRAPPSRVISSVTGSFITAAVSPTPELPRPVVN